MAERSAPYLVCYDIREDRRLRRVHGLLQSWGLRMQYSVFECWLTQRGRYQLTELLRRTIDERVDDVRIYSLEPRATIHYQGCAPVPPGLVIEGLDMQPIQPDRGLVLAYGSNGDRNH